MNIDIKLDKIDNEDLLTIYSKVKDFISFLDNEIETSEVEKKSNEWSDNSKNW